jgi:hypothetical protein
MPLSIETATQWYPELEDNWQTIQDDRAPPFNSQHEMKAGVVAVTVSYHISVDGKGSIQAQMQWEGKGAHCDLSTYYAPTQTSSSNPRRFAMLALNGRGKHPIPQQTVQASLPGKKLSDLIEMPPEIARCGDYLIAAVEDVELMNTVKLTLIA